MKERINIQIIIDSREKDRTIKAKEFYEEEGLEAEIQTLEIGDYVFDNQVVFEYKTMSDFFNSLQNESLFNECANQARKYPYHYLIVAGDARKYCQNTWNWRRAKYNNNYNRYLLLTMGAFTGALRRLRTFTTPITVKDEEEAFEEMLQQARKCLDGRTKHYANVTRPVPTQDAVDVILTSCKGVSMKKAERIRKTHNIQNIHDLLNLTVKDLQLVNGIGEKTAVNLYQFIHTRKK